MGDPVACERIVTSWINKKQETGSELINWTELAQDRLEWRVSFNFGLP